MCPDPSSNLTQVQEISEWILNANLPVSLPALEKKLEELKNLAASLPNTENVLKEAKPQLDTAKKLLQEADAARSGRKVNTGTGRHFKYLSKKKTEATTKIYPNVSRNKTALFKKRLAHPVFGRKREKQSSKLLCLFSFTTQFIS